MFARRTNWSLTKNRYSCALETHRRAGREVLDLTASNPTIVGLSYRGEALLHALTKGEALTYEPEPKGLPVAREAVAAYYAKHQSTVSPDDVILTTSTSEGYSFVFRLLCDPGDAVLVPSPSYPLFDFLADLQDVKLVPYHLVYDHGWQIDFHSLRSAMERARAQGAACRAVLVVHPNNPTGSFVKGHEAEELQRLCSANEMAIIADEVFLDYVVDSAVNPLTFSGSGHQAGEDLGPDGKTSERDIRPTIAGPARDCLMFTLSGLSKISALPQMKVAWVAVSGQTQLKDQALARLEVIADTFLSMNAPVQWAIPTLLEEGFNLQLQIMTRIRENLAQLDSQLGAQTLCQRLAIEGGWYVVLRIPATGSDEEFALALLESTSVLVHPGYFYDFISAGYIVLSLITPQGEFKEGVSRLLTFVSGI